MLNDFFASIYELLFFDEAFSPNLYYFRLYSAIGLITLIVSIGVPILYYLAFNHPRFNKKFHWFITLLGNAAIIGVVTPALILSYFEVKEVNENFFIEIVGFTVINILFATFIFTTTSFAIKEFSTNCSKTPV